MPGTTPPTSQLEWLSSTTAMIVLFWSRATRDLLRSFGWGIAALHRLHAATKLPRPRRPPHSVYWSREAGHRVNQRRTRTPEDFCAIPLIRRSETLHGGSPFGGDRDSTSDANLQAS